MKIKTISFIIIVVGLSYMSVDGWLMSWWFVPDYRIVGPSFISGKSFYSSNTFFIFWALSIPLGSIITALGLALYIQLEKFRLLLFIIFSLVFLTWLGLWSQSVLYSALYGIGGGVILLSFCISIWSLAKTRMQSQGNSKSIFDLRAIAYIFFVITAWGMCGLIGVPAFGLRPEQLLEFKTQGILITMGTKVIVSFALGWIFLALSQYVEYRSLKIKKVT
jgi:hypothetical protein